MDFREGNWSDRVLDALTGRRVPLASPQAKAERERLRSWWGVVLAIIAGALIAAGVVYSHKLNAEEIPVHVFEQDGTTIRLMRGPCVEPMIVVFVAQAAPQYAERFKAIESVWPYRDGSVKRHAGFWMEMSTEETRGGAAFVMLFDDGQRIVVDKAEFLRGKGSGT